MPLIKYELTDQNYEESQQNKFLMKNLNCNRLAYLLEESVEKF